MQVIYPRMAEQYGRTGKLKDLFRMTVKPMLAECAWHGSARRRRLVADAPGRDSLLLPKYVAGVPAMRWWLLPPLLLRFTPVNHVFVVAQAARPLRVAMLLGMGAYAGRRVLAGSSTSVQPGGLPAGHARGANRSSSSPVTP